MEGTNDTAPREAVGCILDAGQDAKMEILDNFPIGRSARNAIVYSSGGFAESEE